MKKFEVPEFKILTFGVEDVITASSGFVPPEESENQTPYG